MAEAMMADFKKFKCPTEIKSAVLKSCRLHVKDVLGRTAHLVNAVLPILMPSNKDLANYAGLHSWLLDSVSEMEENQKEDRLEIQIRLDKVNTNLEAVMPMMRSMQVKQKLKDATKHKLHIRIKDFLKNDRK